MFKENKYSIWYFNLIAKANKRNLIKGVERHHIIPKCLGGKNTSENIVRLTYREHYIAHVLLTKMHDSKKLINALWQMSFKNKGKYFNSRLYEFSRAKYVESISGENHWSKKPGFETNRWSDERRKSFSEAVSGKNHFSKRIDMSKHTEMMRSKISEQKKTEIIEHARKRFIEDNPMKKERNKIWARKPKEIVECPYCKKQGGKPVMMRYHFEECKQK